MEKPAVVLPEPVLHEAMLRRLHRRAVSSGRIVVPAVPGMLEDYVAMCDRAFAAIGVHFTPDQIARLREVLEGQLAEAFTASPRSDIVITYDSPTGLTVDYHVHAHWASLDQAYDNWVATREAPYFGTEPDARVLALAVEAVDAAECPVLDVGAGTGRNSLALARRGHPVDAVEMAPKFAESLRLEAAREGLALRVLERDVFATIGDLRRDYGLIVVSEVTSDFRTQDQLRTVFEIAAHTLAPGGRLVLNAFVTRSGYTPNAATRELGQQAYTGMYTPAEVAAACNGLALELVSDESVYDFEKAHLPATAWPPTSWYEGWVSGQDVFDVPRQDSPIEMRWLVYKKLI
jgi:precorrin-6B methylase 2